MTPSDYSTWLTKQAAAGAIGVTTKSVERFVQAGQIQQARWQRDGRGPLLAVYHPDDVARIAQERRPGPLAAFVVPAAAAVAAPTNGNGANLHLPNATSALTPIQTGADTDPLRLFAAALVQAVLSQTSETSPVSETLYVTVKEAAAILGLPQVDVLTLVHEGDLNHRRTRRGGIRIRRKDLEAL